MEETESFKISAKEAKKLKVGDKVEVYYSGVVGKVEVPPHDLDEHTDGHYSTVGIKVLERSVKSAGKATKDELAIKDLVEEPEDEMPFDD